MKLPLNSTHLRKEYVDLIYVKISYQKKKFQSYERVNKHSKDLRALKINNRKTNLGNCLRRQNQFSNTSKA